MAEISFHSDIQVIDPGWCELKFGQVIFKLISIYCFMYDGTGTTRTPAFWGYPPPTHDYPYHWVLLDPKSEEDKISIFWNLKQAFHTTHLLKLLDKMCKYEMDPMSIVEDTERTRFCPQTDRRTRWNQYTPFQLRWSGGYDNGTGVSPGVLPNWLSKLKWYECLRTNLAALKFCAN